MLWKDRYDKQTEIRRKMTNRQSETDRMSERGRKDTPKERTDNRQTQR
jgi:hypothetical protein